MTDGQILLSDGTDYVSTFILNVGGTDVHVHKVGLTDPETGLLPRVVAAAPADGTAGLAVYVVGGFAGELSLVDPDDADSVAAVMRTDPWPDSKGLVVREAHAAEQTSLLEEAVRLLTLLLEKQP